MIPLKRELSLDILWRPFVLLPEVPNNGAPWQLTDSEMRLFRAAVESRASRFDIPITVPAFRPDTRPALAMAEFAKQTPFFDSFQEVVYEAYWGESQDIGNLRVLKTLAFSVGIDANAAAAAATSEIFNTAVTESTYELAKLPHVAIPTFVIGDYVVYGLPDDEYDSIKGALSLALNAGIHG
jgi:predicted DsbA family dithiol-disulfide isomerase